MGRGPDGGDPMIEENDAGEVTAFDGGGCQLHDTVERLLDCVSRKQEIDHGRHGIGQPRNCILILNGNIATGHAVFFGWIRLRGIIPLMLYGRKGRPPTVASAAHHATTSAVLDPRRLATTVDYRDGV